MLLFNPAKHVLHILDTMFNPEAIQQILLIHRGHPVEALPVGPGIFGDGSINLQNPSHTYATTGNYQVCLTITGINGCTDTYCSRVDILGPYCTSNFFSYGSNPLQASFVDNSSSSSTITGWAWDFGDGNTSNLQNPVHTYAAGGYFYVCLTISTNSGLQ